VIELLILGLAITACILSYSLGRARELDRWRGPQWKNNHRAIKRARKKLREDD
jgi:hypothetical protein